jgi:hypothetical protein
VDLIERSEKTAPHLSREALAKATELVERDDDSGFDVHARWVLDTGSDEYRSTFTKALQGRQHEWSLRGGHRRRPGPHARAGDGIDRRSGGFLIPFQLDPTIILTSGGSVHPFREIARQVVATGALWNGVSSTGAVA